MLRAGVAVSSTALGFVPTGGDFSTAGFIAGTPPAWIASSRCWKVLIASRCSLISALRASTSFLRRSISLVVSGKRLALDFL